MLPFILQGTIPKFIAAILNPFQQETTVSFAAANSWFLFNWVDIYGIAAIRTDDVFIVLTLKNWGHVLFFIFSIGLFLIVLFRYWRKKMGMPLTQLFLFCALICLGAFFFSTGMHERYAHLAIPFVLLWSIKSKKILPSILFTIN